MIDKKRNIKRGITIMFDSFFIYILFHFANTNDLFAIGSSIENRLHIHTEIDVETMRSFITTIFSGIGASTFVSLCFFIVDYQNSKTKTFIAITDESSRLLCHYRDIPYIDQTYYGRLCILYYEEFLSVAQNKKANDLASKIITPYPSKSVEVKLPHKANLEKYLLEHPEHLKLHFSGTSISIEKKLEDILFQIHHDIAAALEAYGKILGEDLETLHTDVKNSDSFFGYSRKNIKVFKEILESEHHILPELSKSTRLSRCTVENRIYKIFKCMLDKIQAFLGDYDLSEEGIDEIMSNYLELSEILSVLIYFQEYIFEYRPCCFGQVVCNKFIFTIQKLNSILIYILTGYIREVTYSPVTKSVQVQNGHIIRSKTIPGERYKDIYVE